MELQPNLKVRTISLLVFLHLESRYKFPRQERPWTWSKPRYWIQRAVTLNISFFFIHFWNIVYLKISYFSKKLPWLLQRVLLLQWLQSTWPATGKLTINNLVNNWVVHGCWLCKQSWHHWKVNGDWVRLSKGWPDRDNSVRDPGNEEPCADQHCHLVRGKKRERN